MNIITIRPCRNKVMITGIKVGEANRDAAMHHKGLTTKVSLGCDRYLNLNTAIAGIIDGIIICTKNRRIGIEAIIGICH